MYQLLGAFKSGMSGRMAGRNLNKSFLRPMLSRARLPLFVLHSHRPHVCLLLHWNASCRDSRTYCREAKGKGDEEDNAKRSDICFLNGTLSCSKNLWRHVRYGVVCRGGVGGRGCKKVGERAIETSLVGIRSKDARDLLRVSVCVNARVDGSSRCATNESGCRHEPQSDAAKVNASASILSSSSYVKRKRPGTYMSA